MWEIGRDLKKRNAIIKIKNNKEFAEKIRKGESQRKI